MFKKLANWLRGISHEALEETLDDYNEDMIREMDLRLDKMLESQDDYNEATASNAIREQLNGIEVVDIDNDSQFFGIEDGKPLNNFLAEASQVHGLPAFKTTIEGLIKSQIMTAMTESKNWEQVKFARGTINGMHLVLEQFQSLDNSFQDRIKPPEKFDKHDII